VEPEARMIRGLYTAASGMLLGLRQQDVLAENMANASTVGYKAEASSQSAFGAILASSIGDNLSPVPGSNQRVIGTFGTGAFIDKTRIVMGQGADRPTGAPLDVMVRGDGFLVEQTENGIRYTRDGHMTRNDQNILVNAHGGEVLDTNGNRITIDTDNVRIKSDGGIYRLVPTEVALPDGTTSRENQEQLIAHLQVVLVPLPALIRAGDSQFALAPGTTTTPADFTDGSTNIVQGTLEEANVGVNDTATDMFSLSRVFSASQKVFATINETLQMAVHDIGR
jgi:flagellar basal-body rod protein FlgG